MQWLLEIQEDILNHFKKSKVVVDARPGEIIFGLNLVVNRGRTVLIADTTVNEWPNSNN